MENETTKKKETKIVKQKKKLILSSTLHIPGVVQDENSKDHFSGGATLKPGHELSQAEIDAYNRNRDIIGGNTEIDAFCE